MIKNSVLLAIIVFVGLSFGCSDHCTGPDGYYDGPGSYIPAASSSPTVTVDIRVNGSDGPLTVPAGTMLTVSWTSQNATYCTEGPDGYIGISGSFARRVDAPTIFTVVCQRDGIGASDSVTVNTQ